MDPDPSEPWIARFGNAVAGHRQIVGLTCGHVHRPAFSRWRGLTAMLCPSTAPALALDLTPVDPDQPDGRPLITDEGPGFALHRWDGVNLLSHLGWAEENVTLARHDARMQSTLRTILSERPTPL
jgi:Icc protein